MILSFGSKIMSKKIQEMQLKLVTEIRDRFPNLKVDLSLIEMAEN